ncbi:MAG TPA: prolyl oligopeptidase family serine peptidase [Opitutaceae bacterium]
MAFAAGLTPVSAIERLPIEAFTKPPLTRGAQLSPDGKRLAFLRDFEQRTMLHVADLETNKLTRLDPGGAVLVDDRPKEVSRFEWVGAGRLLITTYVGDSLYGVIAVDWDGKNATPIGGYENNKIMLSGQFFANEVIHRFFDKDESVLMLDRHTDGVGNRNRPDIIRINTDTGHRRTVVKNPGEVALWGLDFEGNARFGILSHGEQTGAVYRENSQAEWRTILPLQNRTNQLKPAGFDAAGNRVLVTALSLEKRWTIFPLDPATGEMGDPLLTDPIYDVVPNEGIPGIGGITLARTLFDEHKKALVGIRYHTESLRVKWFDPDYIKYQAAVDRAMPNTVNVLIDQSRDGRKMLWFGFSDQNPGEYRLLDLDKKSFTSMGVTRPWINPAQMAPMLAVKYPARDGLVIHGYLTVPVGYELKDLPLVVMPHGGPWVRDVWGFDPIVQLIANCGYAVLQMNYRGSLGYGEEFYQNARREIGGRIQDDIEDATRWAIAAGIADPKRIAIFGGSYGGYSALFGLGKNPELYRCGISFAGVTDWPAIYEDSDVAESKLAKKYWREQIGDPEKDRINLRAISPVYFADQITAPVLIIQGKQDQRVPQDQAKRMISALEKVGRKPESLILSRLGHNLGQESDRNQIFKAIVEFLEKNLGPGVP